MLHNLATNERARIIILFYSRSVTPHTHNTRVIILFERLTYEKIQDACSDA